MKKVLQLLNLEEFKKTENPSGETKLINVGPRSLVQPGDLEGMEFYIKDRGADLIPGMFPLVVGLNDKFCIVQACQMVDKSQDARLKDGGMVWFEEAFTEEQEEEASVYVQTALQKRNGPLYGPSFPKPE